MTTPAPTPAPTAAPSNSGFLITDQGLVVASTANPGGPYIHITNFKVGSGVNYTPSRSQTDIQGTLLFEGAPMSYNIIDEDTVQVLLLMDQTIGTFNFGEVGIYLEDGTLFAMCVWNTLQQKVRAVGNQAGNIWKIKADLLLQQAPAIVEVTVINTMAILEVPDWPSLIAPVNQPSGANAAIVHEQDYSGDPILVVRNSDYDWALVNYIELVTGSLSDSGASATLNTVTHPMIGEFSWNLPSTNSVYVVKFANGDVRRVLDLVNSTTLLFYPNEPVIPTGGFSVWEDESAYMVDAQTAWASTLEYNELVAEFNPYWSTPSGVYSGSNKGLGQHAIPSLTEHPRLTDWQLLSGAVVSANMLIGGNTSAVNVNEDYLYSPNDIEGEGLYTKMLDYTALMNAITYYTQHVNNTLESAQEAPTTLTPSSTYTYSGPIGYDMNMNWTIGYSGSISLFEALLNGGSYLEFVVTPVSGSSPAYTAISNALAALGGGIIWDAVSCRAVSNIGTTAGIGLWGIQNIAYNASGTQLWRYNFTDTNGDGWSLYLNANYLPGVSINVNFTILQTSNAVQPLGNVSFEFELIPYRPKVSILNSPVLAFPSVNSSSFTFLPTTPSASTPAPTPAPTAPPVGQQVFTAVGVHNFTVPANVYSIEAVLQAAGGNGAPGKASGGSGGNGGSTGQRLVQNISVTPGQVLTLYVPPGNASAYISGYFAAQAGNNTTLHGAASGVSGHGGNGASLPNPSGGTGGVGGAASYGTSKNTPPGPGQGTGDINTGQNGFYASGYGSGGGGGGSDDSTGPGAGGIGSQGFIILTWGEASGYGSQSIIGGQPGGVAFAGAPAPAPSPTPAPPPSGDGADGTGSDSDGGTDSDGSDGSDGGAGGDDGDDS